MKIYFLPIFLFFNFALIGQSSDADRLRAALLEDTPIENDLQQLCDEIGGRVTGADSNAAAVDWGLQKFQEAGVDAIKDPFEMPSLWLPKSTQMTFTNMLDFKPHVVAKYHSPTGKYIGDMISVGTGTPEEIAALGTQVRGKFILVEMDLCLDIGGLFAEYAAATTVENAARIAGVKGIIFMSSRPKKLLYRFITSKATDENLPQFVMAREDAKRCQRLLESGKNIRVSVDVQAETGGSFESHNVIAEIKGSEYPDEVVLIGAHIDSWALGTGANDNGCNVSMMIDIARQMKTLGIKPKRTIRFALWNGEEQGYFGSWDYTKDHVNEMDKHIMAMSVDIGSGAITGFFTNGREELVHATDKILAGYPDTSATFTSINVPIVGTDNFDFMLQGVGNLVANHLSATYGLNYHASSDTYDKVDIPQLKKNAAIVGTVALGYANMSKEEVNWKQQSRAEVQALFDEHKLEFTMRMFNVWEPWSTGQRGVK